MGKGLGLKIFLGILLGIWVLFAFIMVVMALDDMAHYQRVWDEPITVDAVITSHDSYEDSEGDIDYYSYASYEIDGDFYEVTYETKNSKKRLTPIGTEVQLQVSPEDPSAKMSALKSSGVAFLIFYTLLAAPVALAVRWIGSYKKGSGCPDYDTVRKDIKRQICTRYLLYFLPLLVLGYSLAYWQYPMTIWVAAPIAAVFCVGIWVWQLRLAIRDIGVVNAGEFELRQTVVVAKKAETDSDGDTTYILIYSSGDKKWSASVGYKVYERAVVGDRTWAAFLPGKEKPTVHYNE